jgi:hypothetical protein
MHGGDKQALRGALSVATGVTLILLADVIPAFPVRKFGQRKWIVATTRLHGLEEIVATVAEFRELGISKGQCRIGPR